MLLSTVSDGSSFNKFVSLDFELAFPPFANSTFFAQLFGWPAYLFTNASGQAWYPTWTNHFDPKSLIFDARHRSDVLISDAFLIGMFTLLTLFGQKMGGFGEVVKYYGIPYLAVNHWLVMITYLQHTDPQLPHYRADQWNFVRGALCTIDRNLLGPVGPYLMHGITETRTLLLPISSSLLTADNGPSFRRHRSPSQQQDPPPQRLEGTLKNSFSSSLLP